MCKHTHFFFVFILNSVTHLLVNMYIDNNDSLHVLIQFNVIDTFMWANGQTGEAGIPYEFVTIY